MPALVDNLRYLNDLKESYLRLGWWYKRLFFPSTLGDALKDFSSDSNEKAFRVYKALYNNPSAIQRWIIKNNWFSCINKFFKTPLAITLNAFHAKNLFSDYRDGKVNFDIAISHENAIAYTTPEHQADLSTLPIYSIFGTQKALFTGAFAQANRASVINHPHQGSLSRIIIQLQNTELLNGTMAQVNFEAFARHPDTDNLLNLFVNISHTNLLTGSLAQANLNRMIQHPAPQDLLCAISSALNRGNVLTDVNFNAIADHADLRAFTRTMTDFYSLGLITSTSPLTIPIILTQLGSRFDSPWYFTHCMLKLHNADLLMDDKNKANFDAVILSATPANEVIDTLINFHSNGLLTGEEAQANRDVLIKCPPQQLRGVSEFLIFLHHRDLLTGKMAQANRDAAIECPVQQMKSVHAILSKLNQAGLLTGKMAQNNFNTVLRHASLDSLNNWASAFLRLEGTLTQEIFAAILNHAHPQSLADAINKLHRAGLLVGEEAEVYRDAVIKCPPQNLEKLSTILTILNQEGLLTGEMAQNNLNAVLNHAELAECVQAVIVLRGAGLLTQEVFTALAVTHSAILLDHQDIWSIVSSFSLTAERWGEIIEIAQAHAADHEAGRRAFQNYADIELRFIRFVGPINDAPITPDGTINDAQSTHTASVHKSISDSAIRLNARYNEQLSGIKLDETLTEFSTWLEAQPSDELKNAAAKRCFSRITAIDYTFTDANSDVSTKQLLGLIWLAIHDSENRTGELNDVKLLLIEALYEVQRGYNLSATGEDDGGPDTYICSSGTFNKLLEKLSAVHKDVEIIFITHSLVAVKFPKVVKEEAMHYLRELKNTVSASEFDALIDTIQEDGTFQPIWDKIETKISDKLLDEFGSIYVGGKHSSKFIELIGNGVYVSCDDITALKQPEHSLGGASNPSGFFNHTETEHGAASLALDISNNLKQGPR